MKADFLKLLDRPKVPLDVRSREIKPADRGLIAERLDFAVETRTDATLERVPALVVSSRSGQAGRSDARSDRANMGPAAIKTASGPGSSGWPIKGSSPSPSTVDTHGDRAQGVKGTKAYNDAIVDAWRSRPGAPQAHPFYYDTCWDIWRTVDYLQTRADVDPERIGLIGISKGGIENLAGRRGRRPG